MVILLIALIIGMIPSYAANFQAASQMINPTNVKEKGGDVEVVSQITGQNGSGQTTVTDNGTLNQTTNNQTIDNKTKNKLVKKLAKKVNELNIVSSESNQTIIAEYSGQKLQELKFEVNKTQMDNKTKIKLLKRIDVALKKNNKSIQFAINGNGKQAVKQLKSEYNILNDIKDFLNKEKGKTIAENDTEELVNATDQIIAGHDNGTGWILQNNPDLQITQTSQYYMEIQSKIDEIKNITAQLKAGGVPMKVEVVDASELQAQKDGTFTLKENGTSNKTGNGIAKVRAINPVVVIVIAGVVVAVNSYVVASIATDSQIEYLEKTTGYVCPDCRNRMFLINFAAILTGTIATWGIGLECMDSLLLVEFGLGIIEFQDFISQFLGEVLARAFQTTDNLIREGCDTHGCIFYKGKRVDLSVGLTGGDEAKLNRNTTINAVISNTKFGDVNSFKVTLYENTTPPTGGTMNFALISTQTVPGLSGKGQTTVSFNWTPKYLGNHTLKVVVDPDNEINETDEGNNEDSGIVEVIVPITKLQLYDTKLVPSSSDPQAASQVTYYFKADHPILLNPSMRTPVFVYKTSEPEYSGVGFQCWYPYGAMWQHFSDSQDVNGTWATCFTNPYAICQSGVDTYLVGHWAYGSGYYQYFAVTIRTQPINWGSGIIKTQLKDLYVIENA